MRIKLSLKIKTKKSNVDKWLVDVMDFKSNVVGRRS